MGWYSYYSRLNDPNTSAVSSKTHHFDRINGNNLIQSTEGTVFLLQYQQLTAVFWYAVTREDAGMTMLERLLQDEIILYLGLIEQMNGHN